MCYRFSEDYEAAAERLVQAAEVSPTEESRARFAVLAAEDLVKTGKTDRAKALFFAQLQRFRSTEARAIVFEGLAGLYAAANQPAKA